MEYIINQRMKIHTLFISLNTLIIGLGSFISTKENFNNVDLIIPLFGLIFLNIIYWMLMYESYCRYIYRSYKKNNKGYDFFVERSIDKDGFFSKNFYFQSLLIPQLFLTIYISILIENKFDNECIIWIFLFLICISLGFYKFTIYKLQIVSNKLKMNNND